MHCATHARPLLDTRGTEEDALLIGSLSTPKLLEYVELSSVAVYKQQTPF